MPSAASKGRNCSFQHTVLVVHEFVCLPRDYIAFLQQGQPVRSGLVYSRLRSAAPDRATRTSKNSSRLLAVMDKEFETL